MSGTMIPIAFDENQYDKAMGTDFSAKGFEDRSEGLSVSRLEEIALQLSESQELVKVVTHGGMVSCEGNRVSFSSRHYSPHTGSVVIHVGSSYADSLLGRWREVGEVLRQPVIHQPVDLELFREFDIANGGAVGKFLSDHRDLVEFVINLPTRIKEIVDYVRLELKLLEDREEDWENLGIFVYTNIQEFDRLIGVEDQVLDLLERTYPPRFFEHVNLSVCME